MNEDLFRKEYLCEWVIDDDYKKAYELWIWYEYYCEKCDQSICNGGYDNQGFIRPSSSLEMRAINDNAWRLRNQIFEEAKKHSISDEVYKLAKKDVQRLSWDGIQKEYKRLFNSKN